jgi:protein O-mannosyl-transferase
MGWWLRLREGPKRLLLVSALVVLTAGVFAQVLYFPFISYDDDFFVGAGTPMAAGLSWGGLRYVTTHLYIHQYFPVTLISHMLDCQLFDRWAGGHHLVNLLLHLACTLLVFAVLQLGTGRSGPSAAVAVLFGLHPLHVQPVVWVAERRELLSTFFCLLALLAYGWYARRPALGRYLAVTAFFLLALLSKAMAVTLPFVFLLVDVWPLARVKPEEGLARRWRPLVVEKLPWLAMSFLFTVLTTWAFHTEGALATGRTIPLYWRAVVALYAYGQYLAETIVPVGLTVYYPYPHPPSVSVLWAAGGSLLLLALLVGSGLRLWRRAPYALLGILFFLGTLLPVIGLVQPTFLQSHADHYTYFPLLGVFVALVWGAADWAGEAPGRARKLIWAGAACTLLLAGLTWHQVRYWRSDNDLFQRSVALYPEGNFVGWSGLGAALDTEGDLAGARDALERSIAADPTYPYAWVQLGSLASSAGDRQTAERCFRRAVALAGGGFPESLYWLGRELALQGRREEAIPLFLRVTQIQPWSSEAYISWASALREAGRLEEALAVLRNGMAGGRRPWSLLANEGLTLEMMGRFGDAQASFEEARRLGAPAGDLAALMVKPKGPPRPLASKAQDLAREGLRADPSNPSLWMTLARAQCGLGLEEDAAVSRAKAEELMRKLGGEAGWQGLCSRFPPCGA